MLIDPLDESLAGSQSWNVSDEGLGGGELQVLLLDLHGVTVWEVGDVARLAERQVTASNHLTNMKNELK